MNISFAIVAGFEEYEDLALWVHTSTEKRILPRMSSFVSSRRRNLKKLEEWEILPRASDWLPDYMEKQLQHQSQGRQEEQQWKPPTTVPMKINVDASCFADWGTRW
ncbi:unnamed protein product [Linum trigynum]|uniref:Uncharacterized protein n=1 Tax=Linum trigynum TaxID=586398 RepID=A0AAV2E936_9ROSI